MVVQMTTVFPKNMSTGQSPNGVDVITYVCDQKGDVNVLIKAKSEMETKEVTVTYYCLQEVSEDFNIHVKKEGWNDGE